MRRGSIRTLNGSIVLLLLTALVIVLAASTSSGQVVDHSGRTVDLSSRIDGATQQAAAGNIGTPFYVMFRFRALLPSDAEAGAGGSITIRRHDGWLVSGSAGLLPVGNPWDALGAGERLLDLSSMQMVAPPAAPVLAERSLLALVRGTVRGSGSAVLEDISLRLPEGTLRLRDRAAYWLGEADARQVVAWIRSARTLPADRATPGFQADLAGLLSVQPAGNQVEQMLEEMATSDENEEIRHRAIGYLGLRPEDTSRALNRILDSAEAVGDRAEALDALAERLGPAGRDRFIRMARDSGEDERLRSRAISYLGRVEGEEVDAALEGILREEPTEDLRRLAMRQLVGRKGEERVAWLAELATNDRSIEIRKEAVRQLGRLTNDPEARRALERLLNVGR